MGMPTAACQVQQSSTSALVLDESTTLATHRHNARTLVLLEAPIAHTLATLAAHEHPGQYRPVPYLTDRNVVRGQARQDQAIPPAELTFMAQRAQSKITNVTARHLSKITQPRAVADVITYAARAPE